MNTFYPNTRFRGEDLSLNKFRLNKTNRLPYVCKTVYYKQADAKINLSFLCQPAGKDRDNSFKFCAADFGSRMEINYDLRGKNSENS